MCGAGSFSIIWSNKLSTPNPVFAETRWASEVSIPIVCSISSITLSGSDAGRRHQNSRLLSKVGRAETSKKRNQKNLMSPTLLSGLKV